MGDASHAIVPFYGQGMNSSFEDVRVFDDVLEQYGNNWEKVLTEFQEARVGNADAIADLAALPRTYSMGKVNGNATAASIYNATVARVTADTEGDYQITFSNALANTNYIIQLTILDCGGNCPPSGGSNYDDPGISYYDQQTTGFKVNIGDSDNGTTAKDDIDLEFMFTVTVLPN